MTVWIYVGTCRDVGDKDYLKCLQLWMWRKPGSKNDLEGVAFGYDVISTDAARVLSTSKEAAARAKELADKAIETELPSDALPGQRAERKGELLQGPSMVREGRKDRPEWCADCLPTARAAAALTRDHFSHAIASHKGGPYSYQQQNRVHLIRAL